MTFIEELQELQELPDKRGYALIHSQQRFDPLLEFAANDHERMMVYQTMGIAYRLGRMFIKAKEMFIQARALADTELDKARIGRDIGMLFLDMATLDSDVKSDQAKCFMAVALIELDKSQHSFEAQVQLEEAAATKGFIGRYHFLNDDRQSARKMLTDAHAVLKKSHEDVYELNNLLWLARVSPKARYLYASRALTLTVTQKRFRRLGEYLILLIGGDRLYTLIKA